jgi:outer membrane receptor protein involved in Fe transport
MNMTRSHLLGSSALCPTALLGLAIASASPAYAQETAADQDPPATLQSEAEIESGTDASVEGDGSQTLVVTGSRIRRPNLESNVPITSVGGEEFFEQGRVSVGDQLNELPQLRSTVSQANSTQFLGTAGLNLLDLRGLGIGRTLVLQNGRRHVPGDIRYSGSTVDVNQIPTDLIERVDIVTGGNSAIYGSDAIAGVVNFVLKRDYEGIQLRGQGGISDEGDAGNYLISGIAGRNFADGRGNITAAAEYSRTNQYFGGGRKEYRIPSGFVVVDSDSGSGLVNGGDGTPDRVFFEGTSSPVFSDGSAFVDFFSPGEQGKFRPAYFFDPDGSLVRITCERVGLAPYGTCVNNSANRRSTFRDQKQLQLQPANDRINLNLMGHFTISEALEPFFEAKYVNNKVRGTGFSGPFFTQFGTSTGDPGRERIFTDNPYLTDQAEGIIRGILGDYYADLNGNRVPEYYGGEYTGGNGVDDIDEFGFTTLSNVIGLGVRDEKIKRETYRLVGGVRGEFNEDWSYEISGNYGQTKERVSNGGNVNLQRYLLALDAVRDPSTGQIVCRAKIDPAARLALPGSGTEGANRLANDVAQCVPINILGKGNVTQAARDYIVGERADTSGKITQLVVNGFVSGDSSQWFELPGGPVGFALGAEYRREKLIQRSDPLISSGLTFLNAIQNFDAPAFKVKEAFAEIRLPILARTPFFEELTFTAAGRVADYSGATGTVYAWNAGAEWAPIRDLRFRGNYSQAVRAPSLLELFDPLGQNFTPAPLDPCSQRNINQGSSTREANCRADGVPPGFDFVYVQSLEILSGGNVNLTEEDSKSLTLGAVVQPRFIPGLALSVDYYDIEVSKVITSVTAQNILDACYDAADLNNQFCDLIQRAGAGGGPNGEAPGRILEGTLAVTPLNFAKLKVRGIDTELSYRGQIGSLGRLSARVNYTYVLQNDQFLDPTDPERADQVLVELGDPKHLANLNVDLKTGPFTFGYELGYIGRQLALAAADYENFFSKQGRPPTNIDYSDPVFAPDVFYHDFRLGIDAGPRFNFYVGVDNAFDRMPPFNSTAIGDGSAIWSNLGRYFYAGAVAKF